MAASIGDHDDGQLHAIDHPFHRSKRLLDRLHFNRTAITTTLSVAIPSGLALASAGALHVQEFWRQAIAGNPQQLMALAVAAAGGALGRLVISHHTATETSRRTLAILQAQKATTAHLVNQIGALVAQQNHQEELIENQAELVTLLRQENLRITESAQRQAADLNFAMEKIESGGHVEDDSPALYGPLVPGTAITQFLPMFRREALEIYRNGTVEFEISDWGTRNVPPRIARETAPSDWRIILLIPPRTDPFYDVAVLPARKLVALIHAAVAENRARGKESSTRHVRISIVNTINYEHRCRSITHLTRQTARGPEAIAITYNRAPSTRLPEFDEGRSHRAPREIGGEPEGNC